MELDSTTDNVGTGAHIAIHPLAIVHMSDQYTRISSGGSPFEKTAPVVGLLLGFSDDGNGGGDNQPSIQVLDADDIPVEISETSTVQVDLHKAVFPQHKVVGWYRVASQTENEDIEPTPEDLDTTKVLKNHYAASDSDSFCFCLLKVQKEEQEDGDNDDPMKTEGNNSPPTDTLGKELPINLYELQNMNDVTVLVGLSNWHLDTSPAERIAVERVLKERPSNELGGDDAENLASHNPFVVETKAMEHSLSSMKDRVKVLTTYLEDVRAEKTPVDYRILRQIQQLVTSLGPLSSLASLENEGENEKEDAELLAHLAIVARTIHSVQSYTEKFRALNEAKLERQVSSFSSMNF